MKFEELFNNKEIFNIEIKEIENKCEHEFVKDDGMYICKKCFEINKNVFETNDCYDGCPMYCAYKRATHIRSTLTRYLGRESFVLPEEVVSIVKKFNPQNIIQIRNILKEHGLSTYYKHVYSIGERVGITPPSLNTNEYDRIIYYFNKFNSSYSQKYNTKNLINYHFILYKIFILIGRSDLITNLKIGKNRIKLASYEAIWNECFI